MFKVLFKTNKTPITTESIKNILQTKYGWIGYALPFEEELGLEIYASSDRRFVIQPDKNSNMGHAAWHLHIDNSDMCSLGSVSVEYIEQILDIMKIYKDY